MKKRNIILIILAFIGVIAVCRILIFNSKTERNKKMVFKDFHSELFGENVFFFRESDNHAAIQNVIDTIYDKMETNQFGKERYALCFFPGNYDDITVKVGFYTQILGLGTLPTDVKIGGLICNARWLGDDNNHNATCNFWRSVENVEILSNTTWAVSQATDMRRVQIDGALYLHDDYGWASGGFLADSRIISMIDSGSQQQWLSRNNEYRTWMNENWNMVFVGDEPSGLPTGTWPAKAYTAVSEAPLVQDKPLLFWPSSESVTGLGVLIPNKRTNAVGISWADIDTEDKDFPERLGRISTFNDWYIAFPEKDSSESINKALENGKNILFTPGIYELSEPVIVAQDHKILLGLGLASLKAVNGNICLETHGDDLILGGLLFDAGAAGSNGKASSNLLYIGEGSNITLNDMYFRVGGTVTDLPCVAERCITIDADNVIGDNLWVWRADHGDQVAWDKNLTTNGIVINGNDVTMYALMVEHFHEYQTVWNGERGRLYMYQSEIPYDVPSEDVWMSHEGSRYGYSSFYVDPDVKDFHGEGLGIYLYNRDAAVRLSSAVEIPDRKGVSLHHVITVMLTGNPGMEHIINDGGASVITPGAEAMIIDYENGEFR